MFLLLMNFLAKDSTLKNISANEQHLNVYIKFVANNRITVVKDLLVSGYRSSSNRCFYEQSVLLCS